ncbi:MAG: hypothetical protein IMY85_09050 [Chloroflexi bacterium]|nr:hypothetical protein [Chloroflexota bacterium]
MSTSPGMTINNHYIHSWLSKTQVCFVPGDQVTPLAQEIIDNTLEQFRLLGHTVQSTPDDHTDIILTTAPFGEPISWRKSLTLVGRMKFNLSHSPTVFALVHAMPEEFEQMRGHFEKVLAYDKPNPADYSFPGLAPDVYQVLFTQGKRGGPIMALERVIQAQAKCIHILLLVGDKEPQKIYHFDLVGGYPQSEAGNRQAFYQDVVLRMVTTVSTYEINDHEVVGENIPRSVWESLNTPAAMHNAALELGQRNFFTEMVRVDDIVQVPAVQDAVASQYSEGCFATWEPTLDSLITTVTGSARPVDKGSITEDDLAIIVGVRMDWQGAQVRHVEGKRNDPPSVEAVEMMEIDTPLPYIDLGSEWKFSTDVPVARSKLHGHRGISSYTPDLVEFVPLDPPYYHFPVTCATEAQARGIQQAFSRSKALKNPDDPRQVVFTVLPTHGVVMAEKWVFGKAPFQIFWEYIDAGHLQIDNRVPQGVMEYVEESGKMILSL